MQLTPWFWLVQTLPESLAVTSLAMVLANQRLEAKSVCLIGLPLAVSVFLIRLVPLTFGIHFILFIVILAVLLRIRLKILLSRSLFTALVVCITLAVAETLMLSLFTSITAVPLDNITSDIPLLILYIWPYIIFMMLLALAINWWRKYLVKRDENLA